MINPFDIGNLGKKDNSLEARVAKLEAYQAYRKHFLSLNEGEVIISTKDGFTKIVMKKNGDITINCKNFEVKASGNITLKGSKIVEN